MSLISYELAIAAARDAANRAMRAGGRLNWSREDYIVAAVEFSRLYPWRDEQQKAAYKNLDKEEA